MANKSVNPECEIILISQMLPHPLWARSDGQTWVGEHLETDYRDALRELASAKGVALVDMSSMHRYFLDKGKSYEDISGNHLSHPDDFFIRIYAQTVAALLDNDAG